MIISISISISIIKAELLADYHADRPPTPSHTLTLTLTHTHTHTHTRARTHAHTRTHHFTSHEHMQAPLATQALVRGPHTNPAPVWLSRATSQHRLRGTAAAAP